MSAKQLLLSLAPAADVSWKMAGTSVAGVRHRRHDQPGQDACGWFVTSSDLIGLAVADGAGSAPQAALGSVVAVRAALGYIIDTHQNVAPVSASTGPSVLATAFQKALEALVGEAQAIDAPVSDLACTLIVVLGNRDFVAAAHVGDGAIVTRLKNGDLLTLSPPTNGEFANETVLLGSAPNVDVTIWSLEGTQLQDIAIFTDGVQHLALDQPGHTPHERFFNPLFDQLKVHSEERSSELISDFLTSPKVQAHTDDDLTLLVAQLL